MNPEEKEEQNQPRYALIDLNKIEKLKKEAAEKEYADREQGWKQSSSWQSGRVSGLFHAEQVSSQYTLIELLEEFLKHSDKYKPMPDGRYLDDLGVLRSAFELANSFLQSKGLKGGEQP